MAAALPRLPSATFIMALLLSCFAPSNARLHYHKPKHRAQRRGMISEAPAYPPANSLHIHNSTSDPSCVFDVREFGAVGDGYADDTESFLSAWRAACAEDSGVLLVPSDGVFMITSTIFSGPCQPGFLFQVDGVLMPPEGPDCWPKKDSKRQWLVFYRVDGMTLAGDGTIEGNGEEWWNLPCKPHRGPNGSTMPGPCYSPALIRFFMSSNLTIRDLSIQNSPQFHIKFDGCDGVMIQGLSINSPPLSPNTDGIHLEDTKHVGIYNSMISNGDDCISIGRGCSDVDIRNVTCGPGHGIRCVHPRNSINETSNHFEAIRYDDSIGSLGNENSEGCVSNVTVREAVIRNSDNGVRIKTWQGGTGSVSGVIFDSVFMENVKNCIIIDQYYCLSRECRNQTSAVQVTDVVYANIRGTYDTRAPAIHFACSDAVPCTNISMSEVELLPSEGELVEDPFCWNAYGAMQTTTIPPVDCLQDGNPETLREGSRLHQCLL